MGAKRVYHKDNIGKKINRLTILDVEQEGKYYNYICSCECGNSCKVKTYSLLNHKQISCGCYFKEEVPNKLKGHIGAGRKPDGTPSFRYLLWTYKRNADKRGIEFGLTDEEFKILTKNNCYYCGVEPNRPVKYHTTKRNERYKNHYLHNGVDRVDNNKGYIADNCVACCRACNTSKSTQTTEEFLEWIKRVGKHNGLF